MSFCGASFLLGVNVLNGRNGTSVVFLAGFKRWVLIQCKGVFVVCHVLLAASAERLTRKVVQMSPRDVSFLLCVNVFSCCGVTLAGWVSRQSANSVESSFCGVSLAGCQGRVLVQWKGAFVVCHSCWVPAQQG